MLSDAFPIGRPAGRPYVGHGESRVGTILRDRPVPRTACPIRAILSIRCSQDIDIGRSTLARVEVNSLFLEQRFLQLVAGDSQVCGDVVEDGAQRADA